MLENAAPARFVIAADPPPLPEGLVGCVAAIGNFDGVHRGHKAVFSRAREWALRLGAPCAALTFEPHPADHFAGRGVIFRLTPPPAKALAIQRLGLAGMIILRFDAALAALPAEDFVSRVLVGRLRVRALVAGYDFHFGKARGGTPDFLAAAGRRHGFDVEIVERIAEDAAGSLDAVSSTNTRLALEAGDVARARALLGHDYFVLGEVIHGQKIGRTLGFPTANLALDPSCRLRPGIYAVRATVEGVTHDGVASYGHRPTFDNGAALLETMLLDFSGDLYGRTMEVSFVEWIRPELKFDAVDALVAQMRLDVAEARRALAPANKL